MAFPSTYNFSYYKGDTFEFRIYPKNSNGSAFDLSTYAATATPPGETKFTIATARGAAGASSNPVAGSAVISLSDNSIVCTITPEKGLLLNAGTTYYYDVQISKSSGAIVYTLLTGSISVTDHISGATA